jgi:hypothetical protein
MRLKVSPIFELVAIITDTLTMGLFDKIFGRTKKQDLETAQPQLVNPKDILFTIPTLSNEFPPISKTPIKADFDTFIFDDDWRQNEFLNFSLLPLIEIEIQGIKKIWENYSKKVDEQFTAFTECHVRKTIGEPKLEIYFEELLTALEEPKIGSLKIGENFVANSFSLQTDNTTYYGTITNNVVKELCISSWNDKTTNEILKLTKAFNLVFINWYHCDIIRHGD